MDIKDDILINRDNKELLKILSEYNKYITKPFIINSDKIVEYYKLPNYKKIKFYKFVAISNKK